MIFKNNNTLILMCDCSCGNSIEFRILDDEIFISALESSFYSKQNTFGKRISNIIKKIKKEKIYVIYLILHKEDKDDIINSLYELLDEIKETNIEGCKNESILCVKKGKDDNDDTFSLYIKSKQSLLEVIKGKEYKTCEIVLNKKQFFHFVKKIDNYLK